MRHTYIIAEAGVNHNGSLDIARQLIDAAFKAGADAVKFQTFKADTLVTKKAEKAEYQKARDKGKESQYEMIKRYELDFDAHSELQDYCGRVGIEFLSSPFDLDSVDLLAKLGMNLFKIPSGEITNLPFLRKIGALRKDVILSTGMSNLDEIHRALEVLVTSGTEKERITVLHCNTEYPTPFSDVNLTAMKTIARESGVRVGYSDHTVGIEVAVAAVALGATIIEKHFTVSRDMEGPDHMASLEPSELTQMVTAIRNIELAMGDGEKRPSTSEEKNISIARKSIVAAKEIKRGELLSSENLTVKRPGTGISPMEWDSILGLVAIRNFAPDEQIEI